MKSIVGIGLDWVGLVLSKVDRDEMRSMKTILNVVIE
jgi:hypothetical protein